MVSRSPSWSEPLKGAVFLAVFVAIAVTVFAWPSSSLEPRAVPLVTVGSSAEATHLQASLDAGQPGAFDVSAVASERAARSAIKDRDAYGAVLPGAEPHMLVASAAGPAVAQTLSQGRASPSRRSS